MTQSNALALISLETLASLSAADSRRAADCFSETETQLARHALSPSSLFSRRPFDRPLWMMGIDSSS